MSGSLPLYLSQSNSIEITMQQLSAGIVEVEVPNSNEKPAKQEGRAKEIILIITTVALAAIGIVLALTTSLFMGAAGLAAIIPLSMLLIMKKKSVQKNLSSQEIDAQKDEKLKKIIEWIGKAFSAAYTMKAGWLERNVVGKSVAECAALNLEFEKTNALKSREEIITFSTLSKHALAILRVKKFKDPQFQKLKAAIQQFAFGQSTPSGFYSPNLKIQGGRITLVSPAPTR